MTKQEQIREGIAKHFRPHTLGDVEDDLSGFISCTGTMKLWRYEADELLEYLHSQGVVIKVERKLPGDCGLCSYLINDRGLDTNLKKWVCLSPSGKCVATESLIGEE